MFFAALNDKYSKPDSRSPSPENHTKESSSDMTALVAHSSDAMRTDTRDWSIPGGVVDFSRPLPSPGFINTSFNIRHDSHLHENPVTSSSPGSAPLSSSSQWYSYGHTPATSQSANMSYNFSSPVPTSAASAEYLADSTALDPQLSAQYDILGLDERSFKESIQRQQSAPLLSPGGSPDFMHAANYSAQDFALAEKRRAVSMQPSNQRRRPSPLRNIPPAGSSAERLSFPPLRDSAHRRSASTGPSNLGTGSLQPEDKLLLKLKLEETLSWKDIAARFQSDLGQTYQIPALQMRYKRLKERIRVWESADVEALKKAREYWEVKKYEIIAQKMSEFGATEKHSAEACKRKLAELNAEPDDPPRKVNVPYSGYSHRSGSPGSSAPSSARSLSMRPPSLPHSLPPPGIPADAFTYQEPRVWPAWPQ